MTGFFGFGDDVLAESVIISAVQIEGADPYDDFIELYNNTCTSVGLSSWKIMRKTKDNPEAKSIGTLKNNIPAKGYYLWENISKNLSDEPDYSTKTYYLSKDYSVALLDSTGKQIDSITWGINSYPFNPTISTLNPDASYAIKRNKDDDISYKNNYIPKNSSFIETDELAKCPKEDSKIYPDDIILNELIPNPTGSDEDGEFVEIYNGSNKKEDLKDWIIKDKSGGEYKFSSIEIDTGKFLAVYYKDSGISLNNSDEEIKLYDPNGKLISSVSYGDTKEGYAYGFDGAKWKWTSFITPNAENQFDEPIETKIKKEKKVYRNTYAEFEVSTSKKSAKVTWNFGDGHKSYQKKTRHKYEKAGKYKVTAKISGGSEDKIEEFTIKVEKFPEKAVKIIGLAPNPKGKDTTTENIIVWNKSKKKVNLKDWSVATGWKNLYNHPIDKDFILKPGEKKTLGRDVSGFALNNKKTKVELRYPDGKIASKTKYDKKTETVKEGEVYEKTGTKWAWKKTVLPNTTRLAKAESKPAENNNIQLANAIMQIKDSDLIIPQEYIGKQSIDNILPKQKIVLASYRLNNSTVAEKIYQGIMSGSPSSNFTSNINIAETKSREEGIIKKYFGSINFWMNKIILNFI
jgi:hypothetical protein